jgi:hypothetical protein
MARAYRHIGLGSPKQVMDFCTSNMNELKEAIDDWEAEQKMWSVLDSRDTIDPEIKKHLRARQKQLKQLIHAAERDRLIFARLRASFRPCSRCGGYGEIRYQIHQDESRLEVCTTCKGTGQQM